MNITAYPRYRWFVFVSLCFVQAIMVMILVSPATLIGEMSRTMGIGMGETIAVAMVVINIFVGLSAFLGGGIVDRFGPYKVWIVGLCLLIFGSLLVPVVGNSVSGMIIIRLIQGCGIGPIMATQPLVIAQWFPRKERAIMIGVQAALISLGPIVCMSFVPFIFQRTGSWETAIASVFLFCVVALALSFLVFFGPEPPFVECSGHADCQELKLIDIRTVILAPVTLPVMFCAFWGAWVQRVFFDMIPSYIAVDRPVGIGMGPLKAGNIMSGVYMIFTIGAILSGIILEKVFRGKFRGLVMIGFIMPSVLWFIIKFPGIFLNKTVLMTSLGLGGFALALTFPLFQSVIAREYPEHIMGKLGGALVGMSIIGGLAGLCIGSLVLECTGLYDMSINLVSAGAFLGFLTAIFLKRPNTYKQE